MAFLYVTFDNSTRFVQFHPDAVCSIAIGANPTAVATKDRVGPSKTRFVGVVPGHKIAVITNS